MNECITRSRTFLALAAAGLVAIPGAVLAQAGDDQAIEEVVVQAPLEVTRKVESVTATGMKTELIELRRRVSYADLDLAHQADVAELEDRIAQVAREACETLDEMYPLQRNRMELERCVERAIEDARPQLDEAIAGTD